jgi:hypothetical protein
MQWRIRNKRSLGSAVSWVYEHGAELEDQEGKYWLCQRCHEKGDYQRQLFVGDSTSSIRDHLRFIHKIQKAGSELAETASGIDDCMKLITPFQEARWKEIFTDWAIELQLSHMQATHPKTKELLTYGKKSIERMFPARITLSNWKKETFKVRKQKITKILTRAISKINISFDCWKSSESVRDYIAVVAHFVDYTGEPRTILLGLPRIIGGKTGENIASYILRTLLSYDLKDEQFGCWMADNDDTNTTCLKTLKKTFESIDLDKSRLRCIGHILNLVAQALLLGEGVSTFQKELAGASAENIFKVWHKKGPIGKLHNIVVYINWNDSRREEFRRAIREANAQDNGEQLLPMVELTSDGGVRWNSTFYMIRRALVLKRAFRFYCDDWRQPTSSQRDLSTDFLSDADWEELQLFANLLELIDTLTIKVQGQANDTGKEGGYGSIWQTLKAMDWLLTKLEAEKDRIVKRPADFPQYYKSCVQTAWAKLNDYYIKTDATHIYRMAIALHPSYRMQYFNNCWWRKKDWIDDCKDVLQDAYNNYASADAAARRQDENITSNSEDEFEQFGKVSTSGRRVKKLRLETEWERWTNSAVPKQDKHVKNPIHWWWDRRFQYPVLFQIAMDIFSIPAMSSECERVFSQLRRLITFERTRLGDDTIESDECQKHWLASGCLALKDSNDEGDSRLEQQDDTDIEHGD